MTVVSDTTTVTYLYQIGRLWLLEGLYGEVVVPGAVASELERGHPGIFETTDAAFISVRTDRPAKFDEVASAFEALDAGELEALALALSEGARYLIVDEGAARLAADQLGIPKIGLLGVLEAAKGQGLVETVRPSVEAAIAIGFRLRESYLRTWLVDQGE